MRKQARPVRNPLSGPDSGQTSGQQLPPSPAAQPRSPAAHLRTGASDMRLESQGTSSDTYEEAERVRVTVKDEDLNTYEEAERVRVSKTSTVTKAGVTFETGPARHVLGVDAGRPKQKAGCRREPHQSPSRFQRTAYPDGASDHRTPCSFIRSHRSCLTAGIAVLLSLIAVGLVLEEKKQVSINVDALRSDLDKISKLFNTLSGPPAERGAIGPAGPPAERGAIGPACPPEERGAIGPACPLAERGATGPAGPPGERGAIGPAGPPEERGAIGPACPPEERGATGPAGPPEERGATGPAGPPEERGAIGPAGPPAERGATGPAGPPEERGAIGPACPPEERGAVGPAGPPEERGAIGPAGPPEERGAIGPAGPPEERGAVGLAGPVTVGPPGPPGEKGIMGTPSLAVGPTRPPVRPQTSRQRMPNKEEQCQSGWVGYNVHCYKFKRQELTWNDALTECGKEGANVASIANRGENYFIAGLSLNAPRAVWIGLRRRGDSWIWTDGSPRTYTNWRPGEPNNFKTIFSGGENCVSMYSKVNGQKRYLLLVTMATVV
ncbi:hypothetical protein Bbelb_179260 [Branchiostoma belcheri]|nr:hypothetical protein Bbelb_179260 [Branchiostoma belcheri]